MNVVYKYIPGKLILIALLLFVLPVSSVFAALSAPHSDANFIECTPCHLKFSASEDPVWLDHTPQNIDDTVTNNICWSCHNDVYAPYVATHSSLRTNNEYGNWTVECAVCHNPHQQDQYRTYGRVSYLYEDKSTGITGDSLTFTGAGWTDDAWAGLILVPNRKQTNYSYKIISNTADTLKIQGPMELTQASPGDPFFISYGKLIRKVISLDEITNPSSPKSGERAVRFFNTTGPNSFADGDATFDGICEVCHTETKHFRNDGSGPDQLHANVGDAAGKKCTTCHSHTDGFVGHGSASGVGCIGCHGHDSGTAYDPDMSHPYSPGQTVSQGKGTFQSHSTHTEVDTDDQKGPAIYCDSCHDIANFPYFKSGTDVDGDGYFSLAETDVCNTCHSVGGIYNGVDSTDGSVGAKDNWSTGVYTGNTLPEEKKMWCLGCHDDVPANTKQSGTGRDAPNKAGDNLTYGFNVNGHGANPSITCLYCHSAVKKHFEGGYRTYDGKGVISRAGGTYYDNPNESDLCISCHGEGKISNGATGVDYSSRIEDNEQTNFVSVRRNDNLHIVHVQYGNCIWCHDSHGTQNPRMTKSLHMGTMKLLRMDDIQGKYFELDDPALWNTSANVGYAITTPTYPGCTMCHENGNEVKDLETGIGPADDGNRWHIRTYDDLSSTYAINFDIDDDSANDDVDNCLQITNEDQADNDSDGVGNVCDNCPYTFNPDQVDSDLNGAGDVCDVPDTPVNGTPVDGAVTTTATPTLTSSAFSDPHPAESHQASQWQITTTIGSYGIPVYDSGSTSHRTSLLIPNSLNGLTTYYWHVRHQDNKGSWSAYSAETSFSTVNLPPNQPVNSLPVHLATEISVTPTLTSSAFSEPDAADTHQRSQWQVSLTYGDYIAPVYDSGPVGDLTSHTLASELTGSTRYYWHVRHEDNQGNWSAYSSDTSFTTVIRPPVTPTNISPANGSISLDLSVTLTSSSFFDLDPSDIHIASQWQVTTKQGFYASSSYLIVDSTSSSDLSDHIISGLIANRTYYWHVRHQDSDGNWSNFSTETSFATNQRPNPPVLSLPANGYINQSVEPTLLATFSDPDLSDTLQDARYNITLTRGDYYPMEYDSHSTGSSESFTVPPGILNPSTWYYWRAQQQDSFGNWSSYSTEHSFKTTDIPNQPSNISPIYETIVTLTPTLTASAFSDPNSGDIHSASQWQISTTSGDFSTPIYDSSETTDLTSHTVATTLDVSTPYFWRVRYKDDKGAWSDYSIQRYFWTNDAPATPSCNSPADNAVDESVAVTLTSSPFSDPDSDTHLASQWQVTTISGNYSSPVYDSGTTSNLTTHTMSISADNSTTYFWHVRHQDEHGEWSAYSNDFSFTTIGIGPTPPNTPVANTPGDKTTGVSITPTLTSSAFSPGNTGDTHASSQWQMTTTTGNYTTPIYDSAISIDLTSHTLANALSNSTQYFWHVRHMDNMGGWSAYSSEYSFTTVTAPPQTIVLHPTGLAESNNEWAWDSPNGPPAGGFSWAAELAVDDGDGSFVAACCNFPGDYFYVDMEDLPPELNGVTIQSIMVETAVRYVESQDPMAALPLSIPGPFELLYRTGATAPPLSFFTETPPGFDMYFPTGNVYNFDSYGGSLEPADVNNLQIGISRMVEGPPQIRITVLKVFVTYLP